MIGDWSQGGPSMLQTLEADSSLTGNTCAKEGISEMAILFPLTRKHTE